MTAATGLVELSSTAWQYQEGNEYAITNTTVVVVPAPAFPDSY